MVVWEGASDASERRCHMFDYAMTKERDGFSVWSLAPMTGDKRDCLETHVTRISALAHMDRLRSADMRKLERAMHNDV